MGGGRGGTKEIVQTRLEGKSMQPAQQDSTMVGHGPRTRAGVFKPGSLLCALASPSVKQNS